MITCSLCGTTFDPTENQRCQSCPLHQSCQLVCCPACGYEAVVVEKSALANLTQRVFQILGKKFEPVERNEIK